MEQRYRAVLEVLGGVTVIDVTRRYGVARQTAHSWLRRYASDDLAGLVDRLSKPDTCPHQMLMPAEIEARIVEMRRVHPWVPGSNWTARWRLSGARLRQPDER